ncbi:cysteine hydrolase family protein [Erwinia sp. JUb26]|uniref:cysteine hydrolase family protein n=1 Tax=Erwinia sp. JUb26 TaxID=2485126 RepID=UPI000FA6E330|nr:isochorismatase family cysteine hydrolase [Erwinia sp. JUb26]ROR11431.1 nicotinamidase-related amidase [Erwinia sp. JUb26]
MSNHNQISDVFSQPYPAAPRNIGLIIIDMQHDFCGPTGWVAQLGENPANTAAMIAPIQRLLHACRAAGVTVIHTREGHLPDLSDLPANKQWRTRQHGLGIGDRGKTGRVLVRGEPGWQIVEELRPLDGEIVIDKPGKSSFHRTDLDARLRQLQISHLLICGVTSDCCVQATMRDAADRDFHCALVVDCTAAVETPNHQAALAILAADGGRWGKSVTAEQAMYAVQELR